MILAVDIGNTQTVLGIIKGTTIVRNWRIHTNKHTTADELAALLIQLGEIAEIKIFHIEDIIISCVVPPLVRPWEEFATKYLKKEAIILKGDMPLGMPILYKRPYEVGADRIVNAIGAYKKYRRALIIIDYGTAITFDCVSSKGEYLGGAIAPGIWLATEALFRGTSRLPRVELFAKPKTAIGQDTNSAIQSGVIYGFAGLTDGMVERLSKEFPKRPTVIATGGLASLIAPYCSTIEEVLPDLTLQGLAIIYRGLKTRSRANRQDSTIPK
ncbi:MAG: type III pantothenate kinase [Dissulfurimicrobium sp.]|uniref:type III pantothenate kinase n=1 Tax=Dissulfurimicrobium TaxID=1769732 RepID=UPI001EDC618E|nr:type III pantothenate kinase [Dissulfurimicrobium hydrothermale]UKL14080.1 type III pantothenate kinase [Dissulfurimicrobium hydrothermale]